MSDQLSLTDKSTAHLGAAYRDTHRLVYQADEDATEAAYWERNQEVYQMVTNADFRRWLPCQDEPTSKCRVQMTIGCKIYSIDHAEALHRAQTALVRLNLVSITILEKRTC